MSATISVENFGSLNIKETSKLDVDSVAGATSLTLAYTDNILADDYLYLGTFAGEGSEKVDVSTITDSKVLTLKTPYAKKPHSRFDVVSTLFGNQINIYRAANVDGTQPADGSFSALAAVGIDFDNSSTSYVDATGSSSYWYKFTYLNTFASTETALADSPAVRGGGVGDYCSVDAIRNRAGLNNNRFISDAKLDEWRQAAQDEINSNLIGLYAIPFTSPINAMIRNITIDLAAGMTLLDDYGPTNVMDTTNGQKKIDDARALLARIKNKELILPDILGASTAIDGANSITMWPDDSTATADSSVGGGARKFRVSDRY